MKKLTILLLLISALLCGCAADTAVETAETAPADAVEIGASSYSCVTGESEAQEVTSDTGTVMAKAFSHRIYNSNNEYVVTLTTTVTFPAVESPTEITAVSGSLSDAQMEGFTISEHLAGDTGTVVLYLNQMSVCHFQYRLYADGTLELL